MPINEESIFAEVIRLESDSKRNAYLDDACGTDSAMRERIEALVRSHHEASGLLNPPVADTADLRPAIESVGSNAHGIRK